MGWIRGGDAVQPWHILPLPRHQFEIRFHLLNLHPIPYPTPFILPLAHGRRRRRRRLTRPAPALTRRRSITPSPPSTPRRRAPGAPTKGAPEAQAGLTSPTAAAFASLHLTLILTLTLTLTLTRTRAPTHRSSTLSLTRDPAVTLSPLRRLHRPFPTVRRHGAPGQFPVCTMVVKEYLDSERVNFLIWRFVYLQRHTPNAPCTMHHAPCYAMPQRIILS